MQRIHFNLTGMLRSQLLQIDPYVNLRFNHVHVSTTYATLAGVVVIELDKARFDNLMEGGDTDPYGKYSPADRIRISCTLIDSMFSVNRNAMQGRNRPV